MELAVQLPTRVIPQQVVRREVGDNSRQSTGEVVTADDGQPIGAFGEPAQRGGSREKHVAVDRWRRRWRQGSWTGNWCIEHHQSPGIDRIEGSIRPIRLVE